jgi:opacity protein-like surface antigen
MMKNTIVASLGLAAALAFSSAHAADAAQAVADATQLKVIEGEGYRVRVTGLDTKAGAPGYFLVVIEATAGYKVNTKFPHKLKLAAAPDGLKLPKMILKKKDGTFAGEKTFTFKVPIEASKPGRYGVEGKLKLSVCNAETCLIKKEKLRAIIKAN